MSRAGPPSPLQAAAFYRLFVMLLRLAVAMLSVTGTLIWWRKRVARAGARTKSSCPA